jgi:hypothetical protein
VDEAERGIRRGVPTVLNLGEYRFYFYSRESVEHREWFLKAWHEHFDAEH